MTSIWNDFNWGMLHCHMCYSILAHMEEWNCFGEYDTKSTKNEYPQYMLPSAYKRKNAYNLAQLPVNVAQMVAYPYQGYSRNTQNLLLLWYISVLLYYAATVAFSKSLYSIIECLLFFIRARFFLHADCDSHNLWNLW